MLPRVRVGDRIVIPACGAYTTAYSSGFNGFTGPDTNVAPSFGGAPSVSDV